MFSPTSLAKLALIILASKFTTWVLETEKQMHTFVVIEDLLFPKQNKRHEGVLKSILLYTETLRFGSTKQITKICATDRKAASETRSKYVT